MLVPPVDIAAAREYAAQRPGIVAFAVRTDSGFTGVGVDRVFPSASVLKAMLLVAFARSARTRPLTRAEKALLNPMIRRSDNDAASTIFTRVGVRRLQRLASAAGMSRFKAAGPIWGNSRITARDQTRFFLHIVALLPRRHRAYGLNLLRTIVPSQRWGIGAVELPGWRVYFKGGWGSGTGRVDHQVALLRNGEQRIAIAVLTADDGSHAAGKQTLEGVFRRLTHDFKGRPGGRPLSTVYDSSAGGTGGVSSAPVSSTASGSSLSPPPTGTGAGLSGLTTDSEISSSEPSGAGSTITVAPGVSSLRSTKSASGSSM
jgi:hypothetical protein